jgi:ribosomal protein L24E
MTNKSHWENVYETKTPEEVSWTRKNRRPHWNSSDL